DDCVRDDLRQYAAEVRRLEDVLKDAANIFPCALVGIQPKRAVTKVERPDVVKTEDVIGMTVCDENGVEPFDLLPQRLLAEIRRRINEHRLPAMFDENGDAQTLIAWINRRARLALAADRGHAR